MFCCIARITLHEEAPAQTFYASGVNAERAREGERGAAHGLNPARNWMILQTAQTEKVQETR